MKKNFIHFFQGLLFILIIVAFIYIGTKDFSKKVVIDNEKFDADYKNVSKDNVFTYVSASEVYAKLKNGTAIIFMGYPANIWSGPYADILNETAKASGIKEILYYDFYEDRKMCNAVYQSVVMKLIEHIPTLDDGTKNIYAPTLVVVKNGTIIFFDSETSIMTGTTTPTDYWNEMRVNIKTNTLKNIFTQYLSE